MIGAAPVVSRGLVGVADGHACSVPIRVVLAQGPASGRKVQPPERARGD